MAVLRTRDIQKMSASEREDKINELQLELAKERGKTAVGGFPENPGRLREIRRVIARIKTIQHQENGGSQ